MINEQEYIPVGRNHYDDHTRIAMTGDDSDGQFALFELIVRQGGEPPSRLHTREDQLMFVLHGEIEVALDGVRSHLVTGGSVFLPRGREHAWAVRSDHVRLLLVASPAGIEGFYRELGEADPREGYIERLIVLAARYGIVITGPGIRPERG